MFTYHYKYKKISPSRVGAFCSDRYSKSECVMDSAEESELSCRDCYGYSGKKQAFYRE